MVTQYYIMGRAGRCEREEKVTKIFFTFAGKLYIMYESAGCGSVWLERTAGGREVAGSNPVTPIGTETIIFIRRKARK